MDQSTPQIPHLTSPYQLTIKAFLSEFVKCDPDVSLAVVVEEGILFIPSDDVRLKSGESWGHLFVLSEKLPGTVDNIWFRFDSFKNYQSTKYLYGSYINHVNLGYLRRRFLLL